MHQHVLLDSVIKVLDRMSFMKLISSRLHTSKTAILAIWISPQLVLAKFGWFSWTNCFKWKKKYVAFKSFHIRVSKPVKCKLDCVCASNNVFFFPLSAPSIAFDTDKMFFCQICYAHHWKIDLASVWAYICVVDYVSRTNSLFTMPYCWLGRLFLVYFNCC